MPTSAASAPSSSQSSKLSESSVASAPPSAAIASRSAPTSDTDTSPTTISAFGPPPVPPIDPSAPTPAPAPASPSHSTDQHPPNPSKSDALPPSPVLDDENDLEPVSLQPSAAPDLPTFVPPPPPPGVSAPPSSAPALVPFAPDPYPQRLPHASGPNTSLKGGILRNPLHVTRAEPVSFNVDDKNGVVRTQIRAVTAEPEREAALRKEQAERRERRRERARLKELAREREREAERLWGMSKVAMLLGMADINFNAQMAILGGWGTGSGSQTYIPSLQQKREAEREVRNRQLADRRQVALERARGKSQQRSSGKKLKMRWKRPKSKPPPQEEEELEDEGDNEDGWLNEEELAAINAIINTRRSMASAQALADGLVKPRAKSFDSPGLRTITDGTPDSSSQAEVQHRASDLVSATPSDPGSARPSQTATTGGARTPAAGRIHFAPLPVPWEEVDEERGYTGLLSYLRERLEEELAERAERTERVDRGDRATSNHSSTSLASASASQISLPEDDAMSALDDEDEEASPPSGPPAAASNTTVQPPTPNTPATETNETVATDSDSESESVVAPKRKRRLGGWLGSRSKKFRRHHSDTTASLHGSAIRRLRRFSGSSNAAPGAIETVRAGAAAASDRLSQSSSRRSLRSEEGRRRRELDPQERQRRRSMVLAARPGGTGMVTLLDGTRIPARRVNDPDADHHEPLEHEWGYALLAKEGARRSSMGQRRSERIADADVPQEELEQQGVSSSAQSSQQVLSASPEPLAVGAVEGTEEGTPVFGGTATPATPGVGGEEPQVQWTGLMSREKAQQIQARHRAEMDTLGREVLAHVQKQRAKRKESQIHTSPIPPEQRKDKETQRDHLPLPFLHLHPEDTPTSGTGVPVSDTISTTAEPKKKAKAKKPLSKSPRPTSTDELRGGTPTEVKQEETDSLAHKPGGDRLAREEKLLAKKRQAAAARKRMEAVYATMIPSQSERQAWNAAAAGVPLPPGSTLPRKPDARGVMVVPLPIPQLGRRPTRPREGRSWAEVEHMLHQDDDEPEGSQDNDDGEDESDSSEGSTTQEGNVTVDQEVASRATTRAAGKERVAYPSGPARPQRSVTLDPHRAELLSPPSAEPFQSRSKPRPTLHRSQSLPLLRNERSLSSDSDLPSEAEGWLSHPASLRRTNSQEALTEAHSDQVTLSPPASISTSSVRGRSHVQRHHSTHTNLQPHAPAIRSLSEGQRARSHGRAHNPRRRTGPSTERDEDDPDWSTGIDRVRALGDTSSHMSNLQRTAHQARLAVLADYRAKAERKAQRAAQVRQRMNDDFIDFGWSRPIKTAYLQSPPKSPLHQLPQLHGAPTGGPGGAPLLTRRSNPS